MDALSQLRHPHIVEVSAVFQVVGSAYVQLPYFANGDASTWLDEHDPELWKRQRMLLQLAQALHHLHGHGLRRLY